MQAFTHISRAFNLISAAFAKEFRTTVRYPVDSLMVAVRPVLTFLPFYFMSAYLFPETVGSMDFGDHGFLWYSLVSVFIWLSMQNVTYNASRFIYSEISQGTIESLLTAPISPSAIVAANGVFSLVQELFPLTIGYAALALLADPPPSSGTLVLASGITALGLALSYGLGLVLGSVTLLTKRLDYTFMIVNLLVFLAGPAYSPTVYPAPIRLLSNLSPYTPVLSLLRHVLLGTPSVHTPMVELLTILAWSVIAIGVGTWALASSSRRLRLYGASGIF